MKYNAPICPKCHIQMELKYGKFGEFWGCPNFPHCRETLQLDGTPTNWKKIFNDEMKKLYDIFNVYINRIRENVTTITDKKSGEDTCLKFATSFENDFKQYYLPIHDTFLQRPPYNKYLIDIQSRYAVVYFEFANAAMRISSYNIAKTFIDIANKYIHINHELYPDIKATKDKIYWYISSLDSEYKSTSTQSAIEYKIVDKQSSPINIKSTQPNTNEIVPGEFVGDNLYPQIKKEEQPNIPFFGKIKFWIAIFVISFILYEIIKP